MSGLRVDGKAIIIGHPIESNNNIVVTLLERFDTDMYEFPIFGTVFTNTSPVWKIDAFIQTHIDIDADRAATGSDQAQIVSACGDDLTMSVQVDTVEERYLIPIDDDVKYETESEELVCGN